jgi:hypothetical protein
MRLVLNIDKEEERICCSPCSPPPRGGGWCKSGRTNEEPINNLKKYNKAVILVV